VNPPQSVEELHDGLALRHRPRLPHPRMTLTDLGEPGPGAELVEHLGPTLQDLAGADLHEPGAPAQRVRGQAVAWKDELLDLFDAQASSRWLDVAARRLRESGQGYYTIGSAGHEGNAAVALMLRATDPALLHYRSGAFYLARATTARHGAGLLDVALGLVASVDEPIAGGRHKVFGHPDLAVIPQTSTIASHLPRAMGMAWTIGRQHWIKRSQPDPLRWPDDSIVVASFGDASANHSTATGAINATTWAARQNVPMPLLLVCEDNGLGISTPTPSGWIKDLFEHRPGLEYFAADTAGDPRALLEACAQAAAHVRERRRPAVLHLTCVRIGGHAGSDLEAAYRRPERIARELGRDPLIATMRALVSSGVLSGPAVVERFLDLRSQVTDAVREAIRHDRLSTAKQVIGPLAPHRPAAVAMLASRVPGPRSRAQLFGDLLPEREGPLTLAQSINRALLDAAVLSPSLLMMGQDIGRKGGVYGVTRGLLKRLGPARVVDTLLDEQTVLGLALGAGVSGLLPVPEIQYLAYLHNAADQLRGEAATLSFFSQAAFRNPMVVRVPGLAYQKGIGGHFHNDNSIGALRDIPGLVIACPAHPSEAPSLLRTCLSAAETDGTVSVFLEPIALYHERDLLEDGDGGWLASYAEPERWGSFHAAIGRAAVWGSGTDLTIAAFGNGLRMAMQAAVQLESAGIASRVVDLRWLAPLPVEDVVREAAVTGRLLIVDETRRTGGVSEGLVTGVLEAGYDGRLARVTSRDSLVPLGEAANLVLVSVEEIVQTARALCDR
jgi:2-oxoisovalerate dehydrogenase E1 component